MLSLQALRFLGHLAAILDFRLWKILPEFLRGSGRPNFFLIILGTQNSKKKVGVKGVGHKLGVYVLTILLAQSLEKLR